LPALYIVTPAVPTGNVCVTAPNAYLPCDRRNCGIAVKMRENCTWLAFLAAGRYNFFFLRNRNIFLVGPRGKKKKILTLFYKTYLQLSLF
jgi:hypothetical protein